jgi:aryl-alcohol dehydrogenase-like predicted oxidoreductase
VYGMGRSEQLLGENVRGLQSAGQPVPLVATKFFPFPWRLTKAQLTRALRASLRRLGFERVDLYQVHMPLPPVGVETWANALADAMQAGLTRAVGVSNYNADQMLRADIALGKRGVPLASNQVHYSLLNRKVERDGLLKLCLERGITLIAYSPLEKGILTGKYTPENLPPGLRARAYNVAYLTKVQPVIRLVQKTAQDCGKTAAQVALNWLICKGAVPIPGAKNAAQAESNAGALGWRLTDEQVAALDAASDQVDGI